MHVDLSVSFLKALHPGVNNQFSQVNCCAFPPEACYVTRNIYLHLQAEFLNHIIIRFMIQTHFLTDRYNTDKCPIEYQGPACIFFSGGIETRSVQCRNSITR